MAEFLFLPQWSEVWESQIGTRFIADAQTWDVVHQLRRSGKPALFFSAHFGHWELPAVAAHALGFRAVVLYRSPSLRSIAYTVRKTRERAMGELVSSGLHAPFALARALSDGKSAGMMVDQHDARGVVVQFFRRPCLASPLIGMLAREFRAPIHGIYAKRLPGRRFQIVLTPEIQPSYDKDGQVDLAVTMQSVASEIETWVRAAPEQWLWLHRRWREGTT